MRVGVFIGDARPDVGGGYTFVQDVLEQLQVAKSLHRFTLLTNQAAAPARVGDLDVISLAPALRPLGARLRQKVARTVDRTLGRSATPDLGPRREVERVLTDAGIDVLWHLQPAVFWTLDIPYITTVWDMQHRLQPFFPEVSTAGEFGFRDNIYAAVLQRAALIVTGNETGSREIQRFYGIAPERIRLLPHPTPSFALTAALAQRPTRPNIAPAEPYIFYPAQFWPHKNHVNLLAALALLKTNHGLSISLALCGSDKGNQQFVLDAARDLGVADSVKLLGFVERSELIGLYSHALAVAYVTFFGPENLPPLEAFALGCPVVASDVAGAREQLGDAALLVDPREPAAIAAAIARINNEHNLRAKLVDLGRARARAFTGADFVKGVLAWLDEFAPMRRNWPSGVFPRP